MLFFNAEFSEATDQNILTRYEFRFDEFEEGFDHFNCLITRVSICFYYGTDEIVFGEGHSKIARMIGCGIKVGEFLYFATYCFCVVFV